MATEGSVFPDESYLEMFLVFEVLSNNVAEVWRSTTNSTPKQFMASVFRSFAAI